jgi:type IV pilus assembly protein PilX
MMRTHAAFASSCPSLARQRGAALVVGLVLMLALTVLGISGINTATLELTMAGNTESANDAFQAAETGIDIAIAQKNWSTTAPTVVPQTPLGDGTYTTRAVTNNTACTIVPDRAFSAGVTGGVMAWHFDVRSTGTGPRGASSTHNQSFYVAGPAC